MRLSYSAISDVGRVRRDNQDSGYAGPHLLVIADGVGGSARGDVASSQSVEVLRRLDADPAGQSPEEVLAGIAGAIHLCHDRIAELVAAQPELDGTSTTVTALVFDGERVGIGHVGDSRGYLLREGTLAQLTTDHTFVQSLVDEGRITEDEARVHPHRNLILRAVDGVHDPEPDVFTLDVAVGDRILLCSDGASGVLDNAELTRLLGQGTPDHAAVTLVSSSLDAGSSDNVTVVVADVVADDHVVDEDTSAASLTGPMLVGAAAEGARGRLPGAVPPDTGQLPLVSEAGGAPAATAATGSRALDPEEERYAPRPPRRLLWLRRLALVLVVLVALGVVAGAAYRWSQGQYYIGAGTGADDDLVVVYRGVDATVPGISLRSVAEVSELRISDLPDAYAERVEQGVDADSLDEARDIIATYEQQVECPAPTPTPTPTPTPAPSPSASGAPSAEPGTTLTPSPTPTPTAEALPAQCETTG